MNNNRNQNANDAVMELCQGIETMTNPIRLLKATWGSAPDDFDLYGYIEGKFTHAIDPAYEDHKAELAKEGLRSNAAIDVYCIEREAWFAAGCLFGMKLAGRPMEEIKKMGISMVTR